MTLTANENSTAGDPADDASQPLTAQEQQWVDQFMDETTLFLGPDPAIMRSHQITSRSAYEEECISKGVDPIKVDRIRKRLAGALDEGYEMCEARVPLPAPNGGT